MGIGSSSGKLKAAERITWYYVGEIHHHMTDPPRQDKSPHFFGMWKD
jgi:hypothetical protein